MNSARAFALLAAPLLAAPLLGARAAEPATTVCGIAQVQVVQCIRAPCPPIVTLKVDGTKQHLSLAHPAIKAGARGPTDGAFAGVRQGAHVCVTGHFIDSRRTLLQVIKTVPAPKSAAHKPAPEAAAPK